MSAPQNPGRYRFVVAVLLFAAGVINYMDRAALGVAAPFVQKDLGLSPSEMGLTFSVFFVGYALFSFVGGHLADRYGPRRVFSWAAGCWSFFCALTAAVTSFVQLVIVRALFGFAEGPMPSTTNRAVANWFPREETARAVGFTFSGQPVGSALAAPIVGLLTLAIGWRVAFVIIGVAGFAWIVVWRRLVTDFPRDNPRVSADEIELVTASRRASDLRPDSHPLPLRDYLARASTMSLGLGLFAMNYTLYIMLSWLPSYLTDALQMSARQMSFVAAIPWVFGFVGYIGGGIIADLVYGRLPDRLAARKLTTITPLALAAVGLVAVSFTVDATLAVALIAFIVMLLTAAVQSLWATIQELVPASLVGGVGGFIHFLSNISGIIGPAVTGFAVQYLGGYDGAFGICAAIAVTGAVAMALFVKRPLPAAASVAGARSGEDAA
jgi:MFS family permease